MKMLFETELHDMRMRFDQTIIRYKGKPIFVNSVSATPKQYVSRLNFTVLENGIEGTILTTNKQLDINPLPLGYLNQWGMASYCARIPARMYKQGLHRDNLLVLCDDERPRRDNDVYGTPGFKAMCLGDYPSFKFVLKRVFKDNVNSCAFSRVFALNNKCGLFFKGDNMIGTWMKRKKCLNLNPKFFFLKELLQEDSHAEII
tara:strand:- start:2890 stop:3495 length:606 start_codon:yes stop_codon:yes gene_type:complete